MIQMDLYQEAYASISLPGVSRTCQWNVSMTKTKEREREGCDSYSMLSIVWYGSMTHCFSLEYSGWVIKSVYHLTNSWWRDTDSDESALLFIEVAQCTWPWPDTSLKIQRTSTNGIYEPGFKLVSVSYSPLSFVHFMSPKLFFFNISFAYTSLLPIFFY